MHETINELGLISFKCNQYWFQANNTNEYIRAQVLNIMSNINKLDDDILYIYGTEGGAQQYTYKCVSTQVDISHDTDLLKIWQMYGYPNNFGLMICKLLSLLNLETNCLYVFGTDGKDFSLYKMPKDTLCS